MLATASACVMATPATTLDAGTTSLFSTTPTVVSTTLPTVTTSAVPLDESFWGQVDGPVLWRNGPNTQTIALNGSPFEIPDYASFETCGGGPRPAQIVATGLADGQIQWSLEAPWPASSEIRLLGKRLIYLVQPGWGLSGSAAAIGIDGRPSWQTSVSWSPRGSPLTIGDVVVFPIQSPTEFGGLLALNGVDGSVLWGLPIGRAPDGGPSVVEIAGMVVTDFGGLLTAVDITTGHQIWQSALTGKTRAPVMTDGVDLFVAAGSQVYSVNAGDGSVRWHAGYPDGEIYEVIGLTADVAVVVTENAGTIESSQVFGVSGFSKETGEILWSTESSDWVITGSEIVLTDEPGNKDYVRPVTARDAATGRKLWSAPMLADLRMTSVFGGRVYLAGEDSVHQIDSTEGRTIWKTSIPGLLTAPTSVDGMSVFMASGSGRAKGRVQRLDQLTGEVIWKTTFNMPAQGPPILTEDKVFVLGSRGRALCL